MSHAPRLIYGDIDLTDEPYMVEWGFDLGSPTTLYEAVNSLLPDGSIQSSPSAGNRDSLQLSVLVEAPDSRLAGEYGEALEREAVKSYNTLTFSPGDGYGAASVLETFHASIAHAPDQNLEQAGLRRYLLTIPALPFARAEEPVSFTWDDTSAELDPLTSLSGWSYTGTTPTITTGIQVASAGSTTLTKTLTLGGFLWMKIKHGSGASSHTGLLTNVTVDGTAIPDAQLRIEDLGAGIVNVTVDTREWRGKSVAVSFTLAGVNAQAAILEELWSLEYPRAGDGSTPPKGVDVVDVLGSARTLAQLSFTAPAGGAFVYTGPDPTEALRERGAGETVFGNVNVSAAAGAEIGVGSWLQWLPQGTHTVNIGILQAQPVELNANGVWPQAATEAISGTGYTGFQYAYPTDRRASVAFYSTSGAKSIIPPSPALPEGYKGDADHFEVLALHPGRCGFAVLDSDGDPISTTVTYYPRWWIYAAS